MATLPGPGSPGTGQDLPPGPRVSSTPLLACPEASGHSAFEAHRSEDGAGWPAGGRPGPALDPGSRTPEAAPPPQVSTGCVPGTAADMCSQPGTGRGVWGLLCLLLVRGLARPLAVDSGCLPPTGQAGPERDQALAASPTHAGVTCPELGRQ